MICHAADWPLLRAVLNEALSFVQLASRFHPYAADKQQLRHFADTIRNVSQTARNNGVRGFSVRMISPLRVDAANSPADASSFCGA